jgi:excisionase family DNA binding protein
MQKKEASPLVTTRELAKFLNVHRSTVQRMRVTGRIKGVRLRGQWRYDLETVMNTLDVLGEAADVG